MENHDLITTGTGTAALQTLTASDLLTIYTPQSIKALTARIKTPADLFKPENNTPSLGYIAKKMQNPELALALLRLHLVDLVDFLNPARSMNMAQIEQTAELILMQFPILKIADIVYVMKRAKLGGFGNLYESIDGQKIITWVQQVLMERDEAAAAESMRKHEQIKYEMDRAFGSARSSQTTVHDEMHKIEVDLFKKQHTKD